VGVVLGVLVALVGLDLEAPAALEVVVVQVLFLLLQILFFFTCYSVSLHFLFFVVHFSLGFFFSNLPLSLFLSPQVVVAISINRHPWAEVLVRALVL
jgi:hypothetical protein